VTRALNLNLSRRSGELLLRVLEQTEPVIAAAATEELPSGVASALLAIGALAHQRASRTALVADDGGSRFVDLVWYPDRNAYGYFDAADGLVVLAPDTQAVFRVNLNWWLDRLSAWLDLTNASHPTETVPDHAWDIGDLWISPQRKIPVLFARRLDLNVTIEALRAVLTKRAGRSGGLILTSSRNPLRTFVEDQSYQVTTIFDVLTNDADDFAIDRTLVLSPYVGVKKNRIATEPLDLSPDGRRLVINGSVTIAFKSDVHITIIRRLVAGHREGKRFRASELLDDAYSGVTTLRRAFGAKKWALLGPFLKSRDGLWAFDL
jgi:hypothetical protein